MKRIETDEQCEKSQGWLIETSIKLLDPLLDADEKLKLSKIYDFVTEQVIEYNRFKRVQEYPGLRKVYRELGWAFRESDLPETKGLEPMQTAAEESEPTESAPAELAETSESKSTGYSSWLDD